MIVVEPGALTSEFVANAGRDWDEMLAQVGRYREVLDRYLSQTTRQFATGAQPPAEVVDIIVGAEAG